MKHDEMMTTRKDADDKKEKDFCKRERNDGTIIFLQNVMLFHASVIYTGTLGVEVKLTILVNYQ
jgi:hypothetical protein